MSILSGSAIQAAVERGDIVIDPFRPEHVNPASVDLTLGNTVRIYTSDAYGNYLLDSKRDNPSNAWTFDVLELQPGSMVLLHTAERVRTDRYVPVLDGKSSLGRLGVCVHLTAGFGDPGYDGQYTLEVTAVYPTRVYAGMRFCQMRFHSMEKTLAEVEDSTKRLLYNGNYTGEASMGPVPSRSWKQFEK